MAREQVAIGCKLPHGLILTSPIDPAHKLQIEGLKASKIIGATYVVTQIERDFWDLWKLSYADYEPLKKGMVFEAKNLADADAKGKELAKEKTGFEQLDQKSGGVKSDKED